MKQKIKRYYKREWLNKKHGTAFVEVSTSNSHEVVGGSLTIADCSRQISLDFDCWNLKGIPEKLAKVDRIRRALDAIEDSLLEGLATMYTDEEERAIEKARKAEGEQPRVYIDKL